MINPCNNTLLNTRDRVFGPAQGFEFLVQALFTGFMLKFDGGTVESQLDAAIDNNDKTRAEFRTAIKALPEAFPALLVVWQGVYK